MDRSDRFRMSDGNKLEQLPSVSARGTRSESRAVLRSLTLSWRAARLKLDKRPPAEWNFRLAQCIDTDVYHYCNTCRGSAREDLESIPVNSIV
uniref:Uncharacterized protein n=1 Tax=Strigamia maritima TaxID=126957 RepID=T1JI79_STRMM